MTATTRTDSTTPRDRSAVRTMTTLLVAAAVTTTVAVTAGLGLLPVDPVSGSTTEAVFGVTAAVAGLLTAALAIGAVIYAQIRNLWRFVPAWIRVAVFGFVAVGVVRSIIASLA